VLPLHFFTGFSSAAQKLTAAARSTKLIRHWYHIN